MLGNAHTMENLKMADSLDDIEKGRSLWQDAWVRLKKNKLALTGLIIFTIMIILAIITPWIVPYSYEAQDLPLGPTPPSPDHWFGTDTLGRDLFTRLLYGGRVSLAVGFIATAVALCIGVLYGTIAGYKGGRIDTLMMRFVDIVYALPFVIFVILLTVIFGRSMLLLFLAIGAVEWLTMARIVRGQVVNIRKQDFVEAAVSLGIPTWKIILRHLIPNIMGPVIVFTTLLIPSVMLFEAFLSFLGLGVQPPMSSWGLLISEGVKDMELYPWLLIFPGMALAITLFSLNFLGDGLRDAFDPRASKD